MRRPEQALHRQVGAYLDAVLPSDAWWFHPPNGGKRGLVEASILKAMGTRAGLPDIGLLRDGRCFWIELKAVDGRITKAQGACHVRLWECGCPVTICRSVDDVRAALSDWNIPTREVQARAA